MMQSVVRDEGYYHLGPQGWCRKDNRPFPENRVETWRYEMEQPSPCAKQQIRLTRVWAAQNAERDRSALHAHFGEAVIPASKKSITLECYV